MAKRPGGVMVQSTEPTRSQLIPVMTKWTELGKTAQLGPVLFCIVVFFAMATFGNTDTITYRIVDADGKQYLSPRYWIYTSNFLIMLAIFLTMVSLYFIYRMIGKNKSWYILLGAAGFTAYYLWLFEVDHYFGWMYEFFHLHLAGGEPDNNAPFVQLFISHFLGTGFFEEIVKALPIFALVIADRWMTPEVRAKIGIQEPLDGILIGAASGGGFAIMETLCQYVPQDLVRTWVGVIISFPNVTVPANVEAAMNSMTYDQLNRMIQQGSTLLNTAPGIKALILRSIDESFGHMAYAGYFGYFIGLSVIKPEQRWKILLIGLVSASIPHALWDTVLTMDTVPLEAAIAVLSYAVLAAAVLKAREISPNRSMLQPSVIFGGPRPSAQYAPAVVSAPAAVYATPAPSAPAVTYAPAAASAPAPARFGLAADAAAAPVASPGAPAGSNGNRLRVGAKFLVIVPGLRLLEHQVPGLLAQSPGGAVAEVTRNPNDPSVLGLTNLSSSAWEVVSNGTRRQIEPGQTIKLAPGAKIDFGSTDGEVG
jgi:RsiW-degrading membrane proteinase PrsW (M82 family)